MERRKFFDAVKLHPKDPFADFRYERGKALREPLVPVQEDRTTARWISRYQLFGSWNGET
jgi:hypothetical protein